MNRTLPLAVALIAAAALTGCVKNADDDAASAKLTVSSTADACEVSADSADSGNVTFDVTNDGDKVTEFYLLGDDGLRIIGEVENIAPGTSRDLTLQAQPGDYFTVCKPGMVGEGIGKTEFTVSGDATEVSADDQEAIDAAVASYTAYTKNQVAELVTGVRAFVDAYEAGDDDTARALFGQTRVNYERIEPTAAQFGDLDPQIDYRKPGAEAEGLDFTGFHRIEMDLWLDQARENYPGEDLQPLDQAGRQQLGEQLVTDVQSLYDQVHGDDFELSIGDITNGAIGLLDEVAAPDGKLPGEENEFAHTDLWDFYANVEGAQVAYEAVRDMAEAKDPELVEDIDDAFERMYAGLDQYGSYEDGFDSYDTVTQEQRNELGALLNGLSEPLSQLTQTVLGVEPE